MADFTQQRLSETQKLCILDTPKEDSFDALTALAAKALQCAGAFIIFADDSKTFCKSSFGRYDFPPLLSMHPAAEVFEINEPVFAKDLMERKRMQAEPGLRNARQSHAEPDAAARLAASDGIAALRGDSEARLQSRFFAAFPIRSRGLPVGCIGVCDPEPKDIDSGTAKTLSDLALMAETLLELRLSNAKALTNIEDLHLAAQVFEGSSEPLVVTDNANRIISVNPAFTRLAGYTLDELFGKNPRELKSGAHDETFYASLWTHLNKFGAWSGQIVNKAKNGQNFEQWLSIVSIRKPDGQPRLHLAMYSDPAERKHADELLWKLANCDPLTGLPNRNLLLDRIGQAAKLNTRSAKHFALMLLNLDNFSAINQAFGLGAGDFVLQTAAKRISQTCRESDTVARLSNDEFAILLPDLPHAQDFERLAQSLVKRFEDPFLVRGVSCQITCSIGVSVAPRDSEETQVLFENAKRALNSAKALGKGQWADCAFCASGTKPG